MTTHYQKIQALGNKMASNLETMGVSASFNDGGLTLADKILQIQHFTNGLLLSADKSVDQSGNTVKLTALLMKNGETVSGATVLLFTDWINQTYSSNTTINQSIGNEWTIDVGDTGSIYICANGSTIGGEEAILSLSKGSLIVLKNGTSQDVRSHSSSVYSYKDGVVYYGNSSVDISSYGVDVTNLYKASGAVKVTYGVSLTTDSNGVASYSYTCAGRGKKTFTAKSGSVVSEPYEVFDCIFYDEATSSDTKNSNWTASNITATTGSGYTSLFKTTSTSTGNYTCGTQITEPCVIEWDNLHNPDGNNYILIGSDYLSLVDVVVNSHVKVVVDETKFTLYLVVDGVDVQKAQKNLTGTLSSGLSITLRVHSSSQRSIGYNNFKVYKT